MEAVIVLPVAIAAEDAQFQANRQLVLHGVLWRDVSPVARLVPPEQDVGGHSRAVHKRFRALAISMLGPHPSWSGMSVCAPVLTQEPLAQGATPPKGHRIAL